MARVSKKELIKLQKKLKTDQAIGDKFGISRQAIHQLRCLYRMKALRNKNRERNDAIKAMYKNGLTGIKISKKVRLSISQVYRIIKR